ncbi:MAG: glycosyltransferase, partial [Alphaproteobacteria bacterium]|nr:glycosyltransferase [Alphaproteobacteria bacterium]
FPFHPPREDLFDYHKHLRVGWVGNTEPGLFAQTKGLDMMRQVCNRVDGVKFVAHDKARHGLIPFEQVHEDLALVDVILCYSACEGTPNPILEASAIGRAWISTDVGIVSELLVDAHAMGFAAPPGIVIPREPVFLARALEMLRDDRELVLSMAGCGYQVVTERWNWAEKSQQFKQALLALEVRP